MKSLYEWIHCDLCKKLMPHKRWSGSVVNFLECLGCGSNVVQNKGEAA